MKRSLEHLKATINERVFLTAKDHDLFAHGRKLSWLFDFRRILLDADALDTIAETMFKRLEPEYPYQVGGLETASIPLITALIMKSKEHDMPVNGFFVRKERKPEGVQNMIEGTVSNEKIILIDDLMNNGFSIEKPLTVLEEHGWTVSKILTVLRFREPQEYQFATMRNIPIESIFTLEDFGLDIPTNHTRHSLPHPGFSIDWSFRAPQPNYYHQIPRSTPALDDDRLYFGTDNRTFYALNQSDGSTAWTFRVGFSAEGKSICSSPVIFENLVCFGSYDGNVYALDRATGKKCWSFSEASWIGSSPELAPAAGLLFIGLEYGIPNAQGGIVALDLRTGEKKWAVELPGLVHANPAYSKSENSVVVGCNDGIIRCFNASSGELRWSFKTQDEVKGGASFDETRGIVLVGSFDGSLYVLESATGSLVYRYQTGDKLYTTPLIARDHVYFGSYDKRVYALHLDTFKRTWSFMTNGRVLATPQLVNNILYVGASDGRLYGLAPDTGTELVYFQTTERILNPARYNAKTGHFFLTTSANEVYCLSRRPKIVRTFETMLPHITSLRHYLARLWHGAEDIYPVVYDPEHSGVTIPSPEELKDRTAEFDKHGSCPVANLLTDAFRDSLRQYVEHVYETHTGEKSNVATYIDRSDPIIAMIHPHFEPLIRTLTGTTVRASTHAMLIWKNSENADLSAAVEPGSYSLYLDIASGHALVSKSGLLDLDTRDEGDRHCYAVFHFATPQ